MLKIKKIIKFIYREIIYGGHLQSLGAIAIIFVFSFLFNLTLTWDLLVLVYLIFYLTYLFNRFKEIKIDSLTNKKRSDHLGIYYKLIPFIIFASLFFVCLILVFYSDFYGSLLSLLILLFGFFYSFYFKNLTKKIPLFKNFYVAFVFSVLVYLNLVYYGTYLENLNLIIFIFSIFIFIKAFLMQIFLDIKDEEGDKKEGLFTLSVIWGRKNVLLFLLFFESTINLLVPILLYFLGDFSLSVIFLMPLLIYDLYCYYLSSQGKYSAYVLRGGEFILWFIFIYLGNFLI